MIPIQELLDRIRWDAEFAKADFTIGYHDRVADRTLVVPLREVRLGEGPPQTFQAVDAGGEVQRVPFHRVRQVWRDGELIWERRPGAV